MIILGIETSCDETAVSIVKAEGDLNNLRFEILGSALHSQVKMHEEFGGVVPNLAKREHIKNLPVVYKHALDKAKISEDKIDAIAVTVGPGLEPALWTGINFAKELGKSWGKAVIPTNHMLGHVASVLLSSKKIEFPAIALLISGGHTELVLFKSWKDKKIIGETKDDAVGEAFDKVARMLGLPYPGGPAISALAEKARQVRNDKVNVKLPRPMINSGDLNFSFSGLKTAVLYYLRNIIGANIRSAQQRGQVSGSDISQMGSSKNFSGEIKLAVAREFEDAVVEVLITKTKKAIEENGVKSLIVGGGVIANKELRKNFEKLSRELGISLFIPEQELTTDNATMIAMAAYIETNAGKNIPSVSSFNSPALGNLKIS